MSYFFLSFRNPETNTNLGVCIVQARSQAEAMAVAWEKDINPGGEVAGFELDKAGFKEQGLELDRLYSRQEMLQMGFNKLRAVEQ